MKLEFGQTNVHSIEDGNALRSSAFELSRCDMDTSKWNIHYRYQLIAGDWINYFHIPVHQHRTPDGGVVLSTRRASQTDRRIKVSDSLALGIVQLR